ncbi:MAG: FHA domain-containing protein [Planctomycetes bacterium]|nr:FHA domain-containing protein [Planctomycetota bacterium]
MKARLYVLSGPDIGRSFSVRHGDTLGRSPDCVVTLKHASLSRNHAHLECLDGRWFVVDDQSRNGVFVGKQRTPRAELADMAEFQLGELHLRLRLETSDASPDAAPAARAPAASPESGPESGPETRTASRTASSAASELKLDGADELKLDEDEELSLDAPDEPLIISGGGARAPVLRPEGDSPYKAAGPFARPAEEQAAPRRPGPPAPAPRKLEDAPSEALIATRATPRVEPAAPVLQHSMLDTGFGRSNAPAGATISRGARGPGERVLQYNKVEASGGTDLAQLPTPARWGLYLVAFAVLGAGAWFAFSGASLLKQRVAVEEDAQPEDGESAPESGSGVTPADEQR